MKRWTSLRSTLLFLLAASPSALLAQSVISQSGRDLPSVILGPQLIAWSQVQRPEPIAQPTPSSSQTSQQSEQAPPQAQSPAAQTFTGTIVKDGDKYILQAAGTNVYQLDDQERAKQYEGQQVKIAGTLDASGNRLRVSSIELLS
jgi:hypothetical protein